MGWFHAQRYLQLPNVQLVTLAERLQARAAVQTNLGGQRSPLIFQPWRAIQARHSSSRGPLWIW